MCIFVNFQDCIVYLWSLLLLLTPYYAEATFAQSTEAQKSLKNI